MLAGTKSGIDFSKRWMIWISQKKNWLAFFIVPVFFALLEEYLWDTRVWHQYLTPTESYSYKDMATFSASFWVALLSVPQIIHYFFDSGSSQACAPSFLQSSLYFSSRDCNTS